MDDDEVRLFKNINLRRSTMGLFDFFLGNDSDDNEKDEHEDSFFNIFGSPWG